MPTRSAGRSQERLRQDARELELPNGVRVIACDGITKRDLGAIMRYLNETGTSADSATPD